MVVLVLVVVLEEVSGEEIVVLEVHLWKVVVDHAHRPPEVLLRLEHLMEFDQLVHFHVFAKQFLLQRLEVGHEYQFIFVFPVNTLEIDSSADVVCIRNPQRGHSTIIYETHVQGAEPHVSSKYCLLLHLFFGLGLGVLLLFFGG